MKMILLIGRILFVFIFLQAVPFHFTAEGINAAIANGVPFAPILVPASGLLAFAGALSVLMGYKAKWGAWLLVIFLIPVTYFMHAFWKISDPAQAQYQMGMFMKNISILGSALMLTYFGSGPFSIDHKKTEIRNAVKEAMRKELVHS